MNEKNNNSNTGKNLLDKLRPHIISAFKDLPDIPKEPDLLGSQIEFSTQAIIGGWSEVLRWGYENNNNQTLKLNDYLLPPITKEDKRYWDEVIQQSFFSEEQVEKILRKFGQEEISDRLDLPWDGYVKKVGDQYEVRGK